MNGNTAFISGHIGQDPEVRTASSGIEFCQLSVCTTRKVKKGDKYQDKPEWFRLAVFGSNAKYIGMYGAKGSKVYAECEITINEWTDKEGNNHKDVQFIVTRFLGVHAKNQAQHSSTARDDNAGDSYNGGSDTDIPF